jgi:hypothetical protein
LAYDRFTALRPGAGFGTFVHEARAAPAWRPALLAWHRARRVAAWNAAKVQACRNCCSGIAAPRCWRHADRGSAYALAREHLVAPVTAELPRAERAALLAAFASGTQKVLVGPRLLDLGVTPGAPTSASSSAVGSACANGVRGTTASRGTGSSTNWSPRRRRRWGVASLRQSAGTLTRCRARSSTASSCRTG